MIPILNRLPEKIITRIPGPRIIGSRLSRVRFGPFLPPDNGGVPDALMIENYFSSTGGAATWFAISDGGAGYIPWGFWQVAIYPTGQAPPPVGGLAHESFEVSSPEPSLGIAGQLAAEFAQLRGIAGVAGYPQAAKIRIGFPVDDEPTFPFDGTTDRGSLVITAPYGVNLTAFYSGPFWNSQEEPLPMVEVVSGYDNPLLLALWSPGNRAILRLSEPPGPRRYPYGYTPIEPPYGPPIG